MTKLEAWRARIPQHRIKLNQNTGLKTGNTLHWLIVQMTGQLPRRGCDCARKAKQMNEWGWKGCWERIDTITQWLTEEAAKHGIVIDPPTPENLVAKGIEIAHNRGVLIPSEFMDALGREVDRNEEAAEVVRMALERFGGLAKWR